MDVVLWLGVVGIGSFISIQLSLLSTALEVAYMGHIGMGRGPYSNVPNVYTALNCAVGVIYAFCIQSAPLLLANFCGLIITFYCIIIFHANTNSGEEGGINESWIFIGPSLLLVITLVLAICDKIELVGFVMAACAVGMMGSPLSSTLEVIRSKSSASIPIRTSGAMLVNGTVWAAYGYFLQDIFILAPNVIGCLLAFVQVGLWMRYELCQQVSKVSDYFFVEDIDDATTVKEDDYSIGSFSRGPYLVPLRPPEPQYYPSNGKDYGTETDLLSPASDISDLTWGTHRSRFERIVSALSPLSPSRRKKLTPAQYPFYGATGG